MPREDRGSAESRGAVPRMSRMTYRGKESRDCGNKKDCDEGSDQVEIGVSTTQVTHFSNLERQNSELRSPIRHGVFLSNILAWN